MIEKYEKEYSIHYIKWRKNHKTKYYEEVKQLDKLLRLEEVIYLRKKILNEMIQTNKNKNQKLSIDEQKILDSIQISQKEIDEEEAVFSLAMHLDVCKIELFNNTCDKTLFVILVSNLDANVLLFPSTISLFLDITDISIADGTLWIMKRNELTTQKIISVDFK